MEPPLTARLAWFADHCRIQQPHRPSGDSGLKIQALLSQQEFAQLPQPILGIPQPVQQRNVGDLGKAR
jgi:hypothetical protein